MQVTQEPPILPENTMTGVVSLGDLLTNPLAFVNLTGGGIRPQKVLSWV